MITLEVSDPKQVDQIKSWYASGRGVLRWTNKDLSCMSRGDMFTPGDVTQAPHWAYVGQPEKVYPEQFQVLLRKPVALVPEWYPDCKYCDGKGWRTVQSLADIRKEDVTVTLSFLRQDGRSEFNEAGDSIKCWSCHGSGHEITPPTFRVKRLPPYRGGGFEVSQAGQKACEKLCRRLEKHYDFPEGSVKWDFQLEEYGMASAFFFSPEYQSLTHLID